ncbi:hypothetical protein B1H58_06735 [Pantoea alhagi]|uniref:Uncharacterized protein n=1 Tax=Pantoea alhagi TaxID=1891675 RepID=A0A1W6B3U2_9GAMM|nr:hypothetical protein [Pantoea alhagi]ARJ41747.1 hypothetical protein B1H58_06735 [Pantoea alhagi]
MSIKSFSYSQLADLRIEGVGIHASFSVNLIVRDNNIPSGKKLYLSATGKTNAAKAAGSGKIIFWCNVRDTLTNKTYKLTRDRGECFAVSIDDIIIGSVQFIIKENIYSPPEIEIEAGYIYDGGYIGSAVPFPSSLKTIITLTPFDRF